MSGYIWLEISEPIGADKLVSELTEKEIKQLASDPKLFDRIHSNMKRYTVRCLD